VVDDCSTDDTLKYLQEIELPYHLRVVKQDRHRGPAAARNRGVQESWGKYLLFLGDDILATPELVKRHLGLHLAYPEQYIAVLGHIDWAPDLKVTPLMRFVNKKRQFGYELIEDPLNVGPGFFYSSNLSLKRAFLLSVGGFDEDFPYAAYEDLELGLRLHQKGMRLIYEPKALAYHWHPITLKSFTHRERIAGRSSLIFYRKHPAMVSLDDHLAHTQWEAAWWSIKRTIWPLSYAIARVLDCSCLSLPGLERLFKFVLDNAYSFEVQKLVKCSSNG